MGLLPEGSVKYKILVVEDDEVAQVAIRMVLDSAFHSEIDVVETGSEALRLIDRNYYRIIFVDLGLLESDGFRITQAVRDRLDEKKEIPIIGITAFLDETVRRCCFKVGMNDVFGKPLMVDDCKIIAERFLSET